MQNLVKSHERKENFTLDSINLTNIGYYYPNEDPSSWTSEEYKKKYNILIAQLQRDLEYREKADALSVTIATIIEKNFHLDRIHVSSIFRSRPTGSQEWSNIGVGVTRINQKSEREGINIVISEDVKDIRTHIFEQLSKLIAKDGNTNIFPLEPVKEVA